MALFSERVQKRMASMLHNSKFESFPQTKCNCLIGTPFFDEAGNCRCSDPTVQNRPVTIGPGALNPNVPTMAAGDVPVVRMPAGAQVGITSTPIFLATPTPISSGQATAAEDNLIFGLNPLMALGIGAGILFLISNSETKKRGKRSV